MATETTARAHLTIVEPDEADAATTAGFTAATRMTAANTGSIAIVEHTFEPRVLVPPHIHSREDEISYVVEGEIGFRSAGREVTLGRGGYIVKPRGELHSMWNAGTTRARMIEILSPGGFEGYFDELRVAMADVLAGRGKPDVDAIARVAARYGLSFDFSEVPDLVARYGLIAPTRE